MPAKQRSAYERADTWCDWRSANSGPIRFVYEKPEGPKTAKGAIKTHPKAAALKTQIKVAFSLCTINFPFTDIIKAQKTQHLKICILQNLKTYSAERNI